MTDLPLTYTHFQIEQRGEGGNVVSLEVTGPLQETLIGLALKYAAASGPCPSCGMW